MELDSCPLDIVPFGLVAALSLAVSARFVAAGCGAGVAAGMLVTGGVGLLDETGGEPLVWGGGDCLSPQATSIAAAAIVISG